MKIEFSGLIFEKNHKYQISRKSVLSKPSCFMRNDGRKDRRNDMTQLIVAFRNFANAPKNHYHSGRYASEMLKFIDSSQFIFICFPSHIQPLVNHMRFVINKHNDLIFLWLCIMNWLYINYQLDAVIIIYTQNIILLYMFRVLKCSSSIGYSCIHAAYGTVTIYESFWWPIGTRVPTSHQELS